MAQDFFKSLPSDVVIDILSRLPVRSVISCKCVKKSWLHLVETREFVKSHLSKSTPGIFICHVPWSGTNLYKIFEFEHHDFIYKFVTKFNLTKGGRIIGSADGLFLLFERGIGEKPDALCICNPITRKYINLDFLPKFNYKEYGFGFSKMTKQYKLVSIFRDDIFNQETRKWQLSEVEFCVYTLGTRSWRRYAAPALNNCSGSGVFANGNLHWPLIRFVGNIPKRIFCFDLETEKCSTFSTPPLISESSHVSLFAWGDCLGLSDRRSCNEIVIWVMKEDDGVEKSWTKELVLTLSNDLRTFPRIYPIKVFENGDVVIRHCSSLCYYSSTTKTFQSVMPTLLSSHQMQAILYTPSFVSFF